MYTSVISTLAFPYGKRYFGRKRARPLTCDPWHPHRRSTISTAQLFWKLLRGLAIYYHGTHWVKLSYCLVLEYFIQESWSNRRMILEWAKREQIGIINCMGETPIERKSTSVQDELNKNRWEDCIKMCNGIGWFAVIRRRLFPANGGPTARLREQV